VIRLALAVVVTAACCAAEPATQPAAAPVAAAAPAVHWYRIAVAGGYDGDPSTSYDGTSALSLNALTAAVADGRPVRLDNLLWWKDGVAGTWAQEDASVRGTIVIMPQRIVTILPLTGDPRPAVPETVPEIPPRM
jgi:hypothetical protein